MGRRFKRRVSVLLIAASMIFTTLFSFPANVGAFGPSTMYTPPADAPSYGALSPRAIQLKHNGADNNKMYATFEQTSNGMPVFPIYESVDDGENWLQIGAVNDTQNGWGMINCPELFELPQALGDLPAGTLLLSGNSVPSDKSATKLELYKSNDLGRTWSYVSTIAEGGRNEMGYDPIWEPFFLFHNNKIIVYYSDERDPAHAQKLVHQTSTDGLNWGSVVEDVAFADSRLRPGMPTVTQMGNGNFAMTYEMIGWSGTPNYLKISSDPENWNPTEVGTQIGFGGNPYITTLGDGRLAVHTGGKKEILINSSRVDASGSWVPYDQPVDSGYNRQLLPLSNGRLFIFQAPDFNANNTNSIKYGDMSVGYYKLVNVKSGKALGVYGGETAEGNRLVQWSSENNALDQYWLITNADKSYTPAGYKTIINAKSGKGVGIEGGSTAKGANAVIWSSTNSADQQWTLEPVGNDFKIVNRKSGKVLAISGGLTTDGTKVIQWDYTGSVDQHWRLVPDEGQITADSYRLFNVKSGKVLGIFQSSTVNGARAVQWVSGNASTDQNWFIEDSDDGHKKLINANSRKPLAILNGLTTENAQVGQWSNNNSKDQQWMLEAEGNYYKIVNRNSGKSLSVAEGAMTDGANIIQKEYTGSDDQHWEIAKIINVQHQNSVSAVQINKTSLTLKVEETETLVATIIPSDASNKKVKFVSNNDNITLTNQAYQADKGESSITISAIKKGSAIISAISEDGSFTATTNVIISNSTGHYGPLTMYTPPSDVGTYGVLSPRTIQLKHSGMNNEKMYTTFEEVSNGNNQPTFPIFESTDKGLTWAKVGEVADTQNGWGMMNCPQIFEMPQTIGSLEKGTLILAGNSTPLDKSATRMDMYKSTDLGRTWTFVSPIAQGGANSMYTNSAIWEPWFLVANDKLIVYISDERDGNHSQKINHFTTIDGVNWSDPVDDVVWPDKQSRPGMPIVVQLSSGNYMMTFELMNSPDVAGVPNMFKINDNPETGWNEQPSHRFLEGGSAFVTVLDDGRIVANSYANGNIYVNTKNDGTGEWLSMGTPIGPSYNRNILQLSDDSLFIVSGGGFVAPKHNSITYANMWVPPVTGSFQLINVKSGKALAINGGSPLDGAQVVQWTAGESYEQLWQNVALFDDNIKIINVKTGKALGIWQGAVVDGANAVMWNDTEAVDQQWTIEAEGDYYKIINRNSGKSLTVEQGSTANGAMVKQMTYTSADEQHWRLVPLSN